MHRTVERMLRTSPEVPFAPPESLSACIRACIECAQVCTACADACVAEHDRHLDHCIRLNLDCTDVCTMTAHVLSRQQSPDLTLIALVVELCAAACQVCGAECERHAEHHAHCQVCAAACHRCFEGCRELMTGPAPDRYLHH